MRPNAVSTPLAACLGVALSVLSAAAPVPASAQSPEVPAWLQRHVGLGDGQIAPVVLERARALHDRKLAEGTISNPCYLAMDATRPSAGRDGAPTGRFYVMCEAQQSFRAVSSGYGNGRKLEQAEFANERSCAKHFSNAEGSKLTAGGPYLTAEAITSFKGYVLQDGERTPFFRTFVQFDGEGETDNAREREIGGHPAVFVRWKCRFEDPDNPLADEAGFIPFGTLVDYTGGRSNGCTTWSQTEAPEIIALVENDPTTLYIYPESGDIDAVAAAVRDGTRPAEAGLYWNAACLDEIGAPEFWPRARLQPIIDRWRASLPEAPPLELPICE